MMFKVLIVSLMAVGALAQFTVTDTMKEQFRSKVSDLCGKNNATDKTEGVVKALSDTVTCVRGLVDPATITQEIAEAKPHGSLDEVFKKYCDKVPDFKVCLNGLADALKPCLNSKYTTAMADGRKGLDQLFEFVCYKDGDRIAMFIAEGGFECLNDKRELVQECSKNSVEKIRDENKLDEKTEEEKCALFVGKYDELSTCVVSALEKCSSPTPANMVEALFKFIKKNSPCAKKSE